MKREAAKVRTLKRRWAHAILALWGLGIGLIAASPLLTWAWLEMESPWAARHAYLRLVFLGSGAVCLFLGLLCQRSRLRCPNCKKGVSLPIWSHWCGTRYCTRCGQPFVYDDEM